MKTQRDSQSKKVRSEAAVDSATVERAKVLWAAAKQRLRLAKDKYKTVRKHFKEAKQQAKRLRQRAIKLAKQLKRQLKERTREQTKEIKRARDTKSERIKRPIKRTARKSAPKKRARVGKAVATGGRTIKRRTASRRHAKAPVGAGSSIAMPVTASEPMPTAGGQSPK